MKCILAVDDEANIRFLLRKVLESSGYIIAEAADGWEALQVLETSNQPVDLILLDMRMSKMNGVEMLTEMQARRLKIPVIVLTAHWDRVAIASPYPIAGHLFKPFSRTNLISLIDKVLNISQ